MKQLYIILVLFAAVSLTACGKRKPLPYNEAAAVIKPTLGFNPLEGQFISSGIDTANHLMYTLYGNAIAVNHARYHSQTGYPAGSVLSKIVWKQQPDPVWFGGNIPSSVLSIEVVRLRTNQEGEVRAAYQHYSGDGTGADAVVSPDAANGRAVEIMNIRASVMP